MLELRRHKRSTRTLFVFIQVIRIYSMRHSRESHLTEIQITLWGPWVAFVSMAAWPHVHAAGAPVL